MEHVSINKKFLRYLKRSHTGEEKAIQSKCLEMKLQMSGRKIRDIVNALRCEGHPICSDDGGYYYAATLWVSGYYSEETQFRDLNPS